MELLVASHIKPWSRCESAEEGLDAANGLLLVPTLDKLFDRGFIAFGDDFKDIFSRHLKNGIARMVKVDQHLKLVTRTIVDICQYLACHREHMFRK
ncbi:HNH endonuclease [Paraburkholderia bannensis]|uniref:HNH endonuclease n=1 Tax=Paraburkholderia bannensis TaxID=765414 RepID=UPI0038CD6191